MISIIIPAYNSDSTITTTINSIMAQTYTDFEIIVVDDGSTDATLTVVSDLAEENPVIIVYTIPNSGPYAARLHGVSKANGEWITFIDADDTLPHNALELLASETDDKADIIIGTLNLNNQKIFRHGVKGLLTSGQYMDALLRNNTSVGPCAKLYRRELFEQQKWYTESRIQQNEDLLMLMILSAKSKGIKIADDKVVYNYISSHNSLSKQKRPLTEWNTLFSILADIIRDCACADKLRPAFVKYRITVLYQNGVLQMNNFSAINDELTALRTEASSAELSADDKKRLRIILSPLLRSIYGCRSVAINKAKAFIKKLLHYDR